MGHTVFICSFILSFWLWVNKVQGISLNRTPFMSLSISGCKLPEKTCELFRSELGWIAGVFGEVRDLETAQMAVQASLTGHIVFSTLHHALFASAVRLTLERCDDGVITEARTLLARVAEARDEAAYFDAEVPLVELMVEACGNLPLRLARRALTAQFWHRLQSAGLGLKTPRKLLAPLVPHFSEELWQRLVKRSLPPWQIGKKP